MGEVKVQSHNVSLTFYRLTSLWFDVNQPSHSWDTAMSMTLHNYRSRQVHETLNRVNPSSSFRDMHSTKSGPNLWQSWQVFGPWASPYGVTGQMTMTVHNYRPRQFHRTANRENPSSSYRDGFRKSGSRLACRANVHPPTRPDRDDNTQPAQRAEGQKCIWISCPPWDWPHLLTSSDAEAIIF